MGESLLPRVLAALDAEGHAGPLVAELRQHIADARECLICHERPVVDAPDAAACGVCMLADLRRIMDERNAAEKRIAALEKERDEWRSGYIHAAVTGRFPLSSHDNDPEIRALRELAEAAFHGQAYAEKARQLRDAEAILKECEDALQAAKNADNAWFGGDFYDLLDRVIRKLAARKAARKGD